MVGPASAPMPHKTALPAAREERDDGQPTAMVALREALDAAVLPPDARPVPGIADASCSPFPTGWARSACDGGLEPGSTMID